MSTLAQPHAEAWPRATFRVWVNSHSLLAFFVFAYAFSWLFWIAPALGLRGAIGVPLLYVGVFGPAVAAATVTRLTGGSLRAWFGELVRFRAAPHWYAAVIGLPILLVAALTGVYLLTGGTIETSLFGERLAAYLPLLIVWTLAGTGEEPGWRGFALPRLQSRLSPVRATLMLGVLWALWHLPLLAAADEPSHGLEALPLVGVSLLFIAAIVGYSFFYTYLWNRTRNVWLVILLHGSVTAANGAFVLIHSGDQVGGTYAHLQALVVGVVWLAVFVLLWATHGSLGRKQTAREREAVLQPGIHGAPAGWRPSNPHLDVTSAAGALGLTWRHRWVGVAVTAGIPAGAAGSSRCSCRAGRSRPRRR